MRNRQQFITKIIGQNGLRMLRQFEVDTEQLSHDARTKALNYQQSQPYIKIDFGQQALTLPEETLFILRRMFYG